MLKRIERHDVVNAAALAFAVLFLLFLMQRWTSSLGDTLADGLWDSQKTEQLTEEELADFAAEVAVSGTRPPNEVSVIVGNGAPERDGLASRATERLSAVGYGMLPAANKDGDPLPSSIVYFDIGFQPDAMQVGALLRIPDTSIRPLSSAVTGLDADGADIIVVLGSDADL